jgi:hypothetical protein
MVLYLHLIEIMEHTRKKVLEWTEINGKKYPRRVIYQVDKLPPRSKGNGEMIDSVFKNDNNVRLDRKR